MNNIYKVIWSKAKNCYVVASEIARSHTKSATGSEKIGGVTRRSLLASLMALSLLCGGLGVASASLEVVDQSGTDGTVTIYTKDEVDKALDTKGAATDVETNKAAIADLKNAVGAAGSGLTKEVADQKAAITANTKSIDTNKAAIESLRDDKLGKDLANSTFATKDALNDLTTTVNGKADEAAVATALDGKANKADTLAGYGITDAYTKGDVDDKLNAKADAANVFTKDQTYTRDQVNTKLADYAKSADVYTKTDADAKFATSGALTTAKTELDQKIDKEIANRITSDTALDQKIDKEIANRITSDTALDQKIDKEIQDRENAIKDTNDRTGGIARNTEKTQTTIEGIVKVDNQGNVKDVKGLAAETITTSGNADLKGDVILGTNTANTVTVNGNADFNEAVNMDKGLTVTGDTKLKATTVDGKLTAGDADLKNTKVEGTLGVTGETKLDDKLTVKGEAKFEKDVTVDKDLTVTGKLNVGEISMKNDELDINGDQHDSTTTITADGISNNAKVTDRNGVTTESKFTHDKEGSTTYAKKGDATDWKEATSNVTADGVENIAKDSKGNNNTFTQTSTDTKNTLTDKEGNTSSTRQDSKGIYGYAKDKDGNKSYTKQEGNRIAESVIGQDGKETKSEMTSTDITNTAKDGTITSDAKDIVNKATGNISNSSATMDTTVTGKATESYGELETEVKGNEKHTVKGDQTNEVDGKQINTIKNGQENIISGGQTNTITGGQINNITGDQTTTITGNKTETVTENVTEDYKKNLTTTVGGNEIHEVKGTKTETVEGKLTENFKGGQETNVTGDQTTNVSGTQTTTATDINRNASGGMIDTIDNDYGTNTETKVAGKTTTDVSIKGTGEKGQYIRGANESRDYLIKGTLKNSETKTAEATSTEITDGTNKASTIQDAKNLAGSVTNGTETGVGGIHANNDGSVSIDSSVAGGGMSSVINQKKDSIQSAVGDGTDSTVIHQDKDNVTIASSNGMVGLVGKDIVNNAQNTITNTAGTKITDTAGDSTVTTENGKGTTFTKTGSTAYREGGPTDTNISGNTITTGKVTMDYAKVMRDLGVNGNANIEGKTTTGSLEVKGESKLTGKVTMKSDATVGGKLDVTGKATFSDDVDITNNLSVGGNATITGDVTAKSYKVGRNTYIDENGIHANNQKITDVADGSISEGSKDAVNGGQLYNVKNDLEGKVNKVGANAAAMANLHPMEFDPDSKWNIAAAIGNYGSETAAALGAFYRPNDDVMVNLSTAFGTGENMVGGGVSVRLGKGGNKLSREESNALKDQVNDLTARMDALLSVVNPNMSKDFPDVPENHWAYEAVSRLAGNDIVQGYPDGEFHGERTMTRYEMAEIIYNALSRGAEAEKELVEEFKPELQAMAASEKATAERAEG